MLKDAMSSKTIVQKLLYLIRCCSVVKPLLHIIAYWVPFAKTLIFSGRKDERLFGRIRSDWFDCSEGCDEANFCNIVHENLYFCIAYQWATRCKARRLFLQLSEVAVHSHDVRHAPSKPVSSFSKIEDFQKKWQVPCNSEGCQLFPSSYRIAPIVWKARIRHRAYLKSESGVVVESKCGIYIGMYDSWLVQSCIFQRKSRHRRFREGILFYGAL